MGNLRRRRLKFVDGQRQATADKIWKKFLKKMETIWKLDIKKQLLLASIIGGIVTAYSIFSFERYSKRKQIKQIKAETIQVDWSNELEKENQEKFIRQGQEVLINEQLSRNIAFLGKEGVSKLRHSFVIVVGLGGVGSHAAHMLCRAGVEHIRLIDFDQVTLSSLNRHAVATREDVGIPKVIAMKNHLLKTVPYANIDAKVKLFKLEDAEELLSGNPDYVLDCIDHLPTKIQLIEYCVKHNIEIISSMGAGAKADPSRIQISGINDTFEDPLARYV
jgi:tRNA A37 threonylcarbamoyladenosine dehydratase